MFASEQSIKLFLRRNFEGMLSRDVKRVTKAHQVVIQSRWKLSTWRVRLKETQLWHSCRLTQKPSSEKVKTDLKSCISKGCLNQEVPQIKSDSQAQESVGQSTRLDYSSTSWISWSESSAITAPRCKRALSLTSTVIAQRRRNSDHTRSQVHSKLIT